MIDYQKIPFYPQIEKRIPLERIRIPSQIQKNPLTPFSKAFIKKRIKKYFTRQICVAIMFIQITVYFMMLDTGKYDNINPKLLEMFNPFFIFSLEYATFLLFDFDLAINIIVEFPDLLALIVDFNGLITFLGIMIPKLVIILIEVVISMIKTVIFFLISNLIWDFLEDNLFAGGIFIKMNEEYYHNSRIRGIR